MWHRLIAKLKGSKFYFAQEVQYNYVPFDAVLQNMWCFPFLSGRNDYGVRSLESILDMVKVMSFALQEGKVIHSRTELIQDRPNRHRLFVTLALL